jgi:hypothetical protein
MSDDNPIPTGLIRYSKDSSKRVPLGHLNHWNSRIRMKPIECRLPGIPRQGMSSRRARLSVEGFTPHDSSLAIDDIIRVDRRITQQCVYPG